MELRCGVFVQRSNLVNIGREAGPTLKGMIVIIVFIGIIVIIGILLRMVVLLPLSH